MCYPPCSELCSISPSPAPSMTGPACEKRFKSSCWKSNLETSHGPMSGLSISSLSRPSSTSWRGPRMIRKERLDRQPRQMGQAAENSNKRKPRTCSKYQKGTCGNQSSHYIGRWLYHHACSVCLKQTGELVNHPASNCSRQQQPPASPAPKNQQGATGGF